MSSGTAQSHYWVLEFAPQGARRKDAFTGWNSIDGTANQADGDHPEEQAVISGTDVKGNTHTGEVEDAHITEVCEEKQDFINVCLLLFGKILLAEVVHDDATNDTGNDSGGTGGLSSGVGNVRPQ